MLVGNGHILVALDNSKITKFFWPTVNNFQNIVESRLGIFSFDENRISWIDEWKTKQNYIGNSNVLETVARKDKLTISIKDFVTPLNSCIIRMISLNEPAVIYCYTKTQLGENHKKDSVLFEGGMFHKNREAVLGIFSKNDVKEHDTGDAINFESLEERNSGDSASVMSFFTRPNKENGTHDIDLFIAIANSKKNVNQIITGTMNLDASKWMYKTQFYWKKWLERSKITDAHAQRALLNMKMLMDEDNGGFASSAESRYSWIREGVYAAYAFDLAGYHNESEKFYSWLKNAITRHKYLLFVDGTATNNNEKRTDQLSTAIWGVYSHYLKTQDGKFLSKMWNTVRYAAEELERNFNLKTGLMSPSLTPWEDNFNVNAYTSASAYSAFKLASIIAQKLGHEEISEDWKSLSEKIKDSYLFMCSDETLHAAYKDKNVDSYILSAAVPFDMIDPWNEKAEKTVENMEKELWDGGLKRNSSASKTCTVSTAWLAWFHKKSGNMKKYRIIMDALHENFTQTGLPSFVPQSKADTALWPHAMYIIARMD